MKTIPLFFEDSEFNELKKLREKYDLKNKVKIKSWKDFLMQNLRENAK